ncbi:MAG: hypothetical protein HY078_10415 [Elusimicrobia bacterium]|nr:hypothetical protein [Elusimicrobiota bacterium]
MTPDEQRLEKLARELARRKVEERLRYFTPNGGQRNFICEISKPGAWQVWNGGGNGSGKSYGSVAILAAFAYPELANKEFFGADIFQKWPHAKRARLCSTPRELDSIGSLQTAIKELFPKNRYTARKKGKPFDSEFITDTGWTIDLFSYDQDPSEMAGPSIGLILFNEPPPEDLFKEAVARTRAGGIILGAATSLSENPWIVDGIFGKADGDKIRVIYSDVEANCKQHGINGTLEHEQIETILKSYDADEREARKTGKPLSFSGRIYKQFDRSVHIAAAPIIPPEFATFYMVVDPAIGKPFAILYAFVDPSGVIQIFKEWPEFEFEGSKDNSFGVKDYADLIKILDDGKAIEKRILDRYFGNQRRQVGGESLKDEFREHDLFFDDSYSTAGEESEVETGILAVKEALNWNRDKPLDGINRPKLLVSPTCPNTIKALERWSRDPLTGKPKEKFKDFADLIRYLVKADPIFERPRVWKQGERPFYGLSQL